MNTLKIKISRIIYLPVILLLFHNLSAYPQNALLTNRLLVTDHIQIVEKDYPEDHYRYQGIDNLVNMNPGKNDLVRIILDAAAGGAVQTYSFDEFFDPDFPNTYDISSEPLKVRSDSLADQIRSVVFIEEWSFDTLAFRFSKSVKGFIPIRHTRQELEPERQKLELTALFRQEEVLSRKEKRHMNRRMVHVKEIAYEFVLTEPHLLFLKDAEESLIRELGQAAYKYYNINWNRHASHTIVNSIIDQSFKQDQEVLTADGSEVYNFDSLPYIVEPYLDSLMESVMNEYDLEEFMPTMADLKYDLKRNVFSIIFFEDWYIDPETLYMEKKVNAVAPVLWQRRKTADGYPVDDPETGYPVYFKSILFRIPFN